MQINLQCREYEQFSFSDYSQSQKEFTSVYVGHLPEILSFYEMYKILKRK